MAEGFDASSEQGFLMYSTSAAGGTAVSLKNAEGEVLLSGTVPCGFSNLVLSAPGLKVGDICTLSIGGTETEVTIDNSSGPGGFGGMGGWGNKGGRWGLDSTETADSQMPAVSTLSAVGLGHGGWGGDMPQMPSGDGSQIPGGGFGGNGSQVPGGGFGNGEMPQMPGVDFENGEAPQIPDGVFEGSNWRDRDQFTQRGQDQDRTQGGVSSEIPAVSPDTFLLIGVSVLFLLAGIVIALKVRH